MTGDHEHVGEPIAIVGSACRFPGDATTPSKLWELLKAPRDVLSEIPESRFSTKAFYHPDGLHHGTTNVRHSYLLSDDHRLFDAQFFGTKPVEANSIDPQQRLLLETVYEGLESAGLPMEGLQGSNTGVYVGLMTNDYADMLGRDVQNFPTYFASGTARSILSNRVSYFFDWRGPSMTIDTACSSSLIALHQAVQSLRSGETNVAVAAGTNLLLGPEQYIAESKLKMLSPTGRSRMWDKGANGYARGDGIAAVILKPLSAALADGDHIECIVRETGANQDGRTKGITMPNPVAQADLIRTTYARAGLDLSKPSDRPQYFEAHGTGTPAGDPVEAEAISTAFFGHAANYDRNDSDEHPLYVGSIKTVIGHTEGTAGLAAVLKASLALQHGIIPPNMLLDELSSTVRPFYNDLEITQVAKEWPPVPENTPRRASVNSFGFGGANAHAILEEFIPRLLDEKAGDSKPVVVSPFNFSASSEKSLLANIAAYSTYLQTHSATNLRDLSWTLNCRRSTLPVRHSVSASSTEELIARLDEAVQSSAITPIAQTATIRKPKLLGVFTGQGAQWARMGAELLESSPMVRDCIARLDRSLQELPTEHRPVWSLGEEILKDARTSRIGEAAFSQPLCTAIQIALVQLLTAAKLQFTAVVGHSSGEIAAAYAAGYLSEEDAIRIAYYRGWSLQFANDRDGPKGAMMAAGTSFEDAKDLCDMPSLEKRICVAASNSSASVTISGDADAIDEVREILEDEKKFARLLKVDKAYHSHHMLSCAAPYIAAVRKCGTTVQPRPNGSPTWVSSVYGENIDDVNDSLSDTYWSNNMINPVLFSQAVTYAVGALGPFDMALEIGPHPALKGPAMQTIQEVSGQTLPYVGTLNRGKNDKEAFSSALGSLWVALGDNAVDFASFEKQATGTTQPPKLLKGLPSYSWDHDRIYWHESRSSLAFRTEKEPFHPLLGVKCPDGTDKELRWRNYLHPREISWLAHHQVQGQMVFPAAGYISAAVEAVIQKYGSGAVRLIDFHDIVIGQALVLEENSGVETIFRLSIDHVENDRIFASFACHSDANKGSSSMSLHASAVLKIILGDPTEDVLPNRTETQGSFLELEADRFYNTVSELGFGYTGPFQALSGLRRKMDEASGLIAVPERDENGHSLIIHPASLDGAIQSIMLAYCFPGDGRLRTLYLPTRIDRLRVNPSGCVALAGPGTDLPFHSAVTEARFAELSGDVDIFSADGRRTLVQLEGLHTTPLSPLTSTNDVPFFTEYEWGVDRPTGRDFNIDKEMSISDRSLALDFERVAHFYFKELDRSLQSTDRAKIAWNHAHLLSYVDHCLSSVANGKHKFAKLEWASDTINDIAPIVERNSDHVDIQALRAVGESLPAVIRGETNLLEILVQQDLLSKIYAQSLGIDVYLDEVARIAHQISHRYPHLNILEIGAGAGATSERVIRAIGSAFASYTFSDIHDNQFEDARERFSDYQSKMAFKLLDIEKDLEEQDFEEACFDLVVAPLSLYATKSLEATLKNVRRLLKPGGYLIMLEITDPEVMRFGLILGGLPGWWLGFEEGRKLSPCVSESRWEALMQSTGFSGLEALAPCSSGSPIPFSVMVTQAVDDRVNFLREPLAPTHQSLGVQSLTIIGGKTTLTSTIVADITSAVRRHYSNIYTARSLSDLVSAELPVMGTVISLIELDDPVLKDISPETLKSFQELFKRSKNVLWLGHGAQGDNPYGNMFTGVQRTLVMEMTHLHIHFLNFHSLSEADGNIIATKLLHVEAAEIWDQNGQLDGLLWSNESELALQNGKLQVPRFRFNSNRNDRYNSSRRLVIKEVQRAGSTVTIQPTSLGYLVEEKDTRILPHLPNDIEVHVTHSLLRAARLNETSSLFLVVGKNIQTNKQVVALSNTLDSQVFVPNGLALQCGEGEEQGIRSMFTLYNHLLTQSMFQKIQTGSALAVLDPDFSLSPLLTKYANERGVQLVLLTTKEGHCSWPWVQIHPMSSRRELMTKLPHNVSRLINMGGSDEMLSVLKSCFTPNCEFETETTLTVEYPQSDHTADINQLGMQLQSSWMKAQYDHMPINLHRFASFGLQDLIRTQGPLGMQSLITWGQSKLAVQVQPATKHVRFSKDKTYWLVGLTGGLGLSLCQWMSRQGARYIALSSRNPKIDDEWLRRMAADGCTVRVFSNDITNRESVQATYRHISETMPPIAGVAQGAMVLQDTMFIDLDLPRLEKVLRPKVDGSILLDELFPENTLDFMVFFSSMAAMTGNPGQVAYNAANMFMASLAAQRRKRGLAAHAINIGAIVGNGYVTRELNMGQQSYLYRVGHSWMSEQDFHEVFAEGVLSCRDRVGSAELCCGLRIDDDETKSWIANPIFQHLVYKSSNLVVADKKGKSGVLVKTRLSEATSHQEVIEILQDGFVLKLQSALQADPNKPMLDMSPDELGVDSLVAVDLRSWFLKELGVDMPVLKIFNAASIRELLATAAEVLPEGLVPNLVSDAQPTKAQSHHAASSVPASISITDVPLDVTGTDTILTDSKFALPDATGVYSGSSATSLNAEDSNSEANDDTSSSISSETSDAGPPKREIQRTVPMSYGQSRFWFLEHLVEDKTAFNITPTFELSGRLRIGDFARAIETAGQHHEALRTFFFTDEERNHMQGVWAKSALQLEHTEISDEKEVEAASRQMKAHVFNLSAGEIMRVHLLSLTPEKHWMIFGFHHINMDGISFEVFWSDVEKAYQGQPLSEDALQYPDFTLRQLREHEEGAWAGDLAYWKAQFVDTPSALPLLPFALLPARPKIAQFGSHTTEMRLDADMSDAIERRCRTFKSTPFHFHLAIWQILLNRWFGLDDVCIGLGDGNRTDADVLRSMGLFLNLLPARLSAKPGQSFGECLKEVRNITQGTFAHSRVPFDVILSELNVPRSASHNPLCQAFFNYRPKVEQSRQFCGCVADGALLGGGETSFDLSLDVGNVGAGETLIHLSVQKSLYGMEHAEILLRSYFNLLQSFLQNPATRVTWPDLHPKDQIDQAVTSGRGPELRQSWPPTIVHRLDEITLLYPDRIALKNHDGNALTYTQTRDRINLIASELLSNGVGAGTRVGVFQSPGADLICSIMAILRVGGSYVPLDRKVGMERLAMITKETQALAILLDTTTVSDYALLHTAAKPIDVSSLRGSTALPVPNKAAPDQTAVIMYTSGSTGVPKGIMIAHSAYIHHAQSSSGVWNLKHGVETVLQQSSYAWDASLWQIMVSLCIGATVVVVSSLARADPVAITDLILSENVTCTLATPTEYMSWLRYGRSSLKDSRLTTALCGGEFMSNGLINEVRALEKSDLRLINAYGPAEITFACSGKEVAYNIQPTSGSPAQPLYTLPNYQVYVVDHALNPLPFGVPGEVVIGGAAVAQGYLDSSKTAERFSINRHTSKFFQDMGWTSVHRTGDRGTLMPDGGLVLLGRMDGDNQVKLRGIRINIEEIETAIINSSAGAITQVVVSVRSDTGPNNDTQFLIAFAVMADVDSLESTPEFLNRLLQEIPFPQHMRPAAIIPIDSFPQNTSGKIDRTAVDNIPIPHIASKTVDDDTLTVFEQRLRRLWQQALPQDVASYHEIRSQSDFFHVGGTSLALINLQALIKEHLGATLALYQLFEASTLHGMATKIQNLSRPAIQLAVDWNAEVEVPSDLVSSTNSGDVPVVPSGVKTVVLTGATGFLGKEILRGLLNDERVLTVHCLAVRKQPTELAGLFSHPKIRLHPGDLGSPRLGLSESDASSIFSCADVVIHNGADVSFMKTYQTLKLINVASTKELVKLVLPRRIPFHFVSTAGVARLADQESFGEISVAPFPPPSPPSDGYIAAKWVSEVYLENINRQFSLPVWIHRPSSITGTDAPELDLLGNVMRYAKETRKLPDSSLWSGVFDLISVQSAAQQLLAAVHQSGECVPTKDSVRYLYESGETTIGRDEIMPLMESGTGQEFQIVAIEEWVRSAEEAGMSPLMGEYLRRASDGQVLLPRLIKASETT